MLVLRRKVGESIVLAGVINVSVLAVEGERVKIGISAPPDVTIVREELLRVVGAKQTPDQGAPVQQR
jgi:carbon storage regulator